MKRNLLLSVILIFAFVSALGSSIFNATHAFVPALQTLEIEDAIDNAEDISLEDVVPVDPFLGSINFSKPEFLQTVVFENIKSSLLASFQSSAQAQVFKIITEAKSSSSKIWLVKGLWLELSNLRL